MARQAQRSWRGRKTLYPLCELAKIGYPASEAGTHDLNDTTGGVASPEPSWTTYFTHQDSRVSHMANLEPLHCCAFTAQGISYVIVLYS